MDNKIKFQGHFPDSNARKDKVVIGLSGSWDSLVAASLLKIQKYDLVGVTIIPGWSDHIDSPGSALSCHLGSEQLTAIKAFCDSINIPHQVVSAKSAFQEEVSENWMAAKLTGSRVTACWSCHDLRMRLLHAKMKEIGAQALATGHFAKLFRHEGHGTVFVHSANDEQLDQSHLLSRLPHEILNSLILPMSDLKQSEVFKLVENFGLKQIKNAIAIHQCFSDGPVTLNYIQKNSPAKFLQPGEIVSGPPDFAHVSDHQGVIHFSAGQVVVDSESQRRPVLGHFADFGFHTRRVIIQAPEFFQRQQILLTECRISEDTNWSEPLKAFIKLSAEKSVECWVRPKNFDSFLLEWEGSEVVYQGDILTLFRKKGKNSKVLMTGKVRYLPQEPAADEDKEKANVKVNHARDF